MTTADRDQWNIHGMLTLPTIQRHQTKTLGKRNKDSSITHTPTPTHTGRRMPQTHHDHRPRASNTFPRCRHTVDRPDLAGEPQVVGPGPAAPAGIAAAPRAAEPKRQGVGQHRLGELRAGATAGDTLPGPGRLQETPEILRRVGLDYVVMRNTHRTDTQKQTNKQTKSWSNETVGAGTGEVRLARQRGLCWGCLEE